MSEMSAITDLISQQMQDIAGDTWDPTTNLLPYCNLGIKELVNLKPEAYPVTRNLELVAGPIQTLGSTGTVDFMILDVVCNMGTTGLVVGETITSIDKKIIDAAFPGWMSIDADAEVLQVVVDDRNPKTFYTVPPQPDTDQGTIRAVLASVPDDVTDVTDTFPLNDFYIPPIVNYGLYRVLIEETTVPNAQAKAQTFYQMFLQGIGYKKSVEKEMATKGE